MESSGARSHRAAIGSASVRKTHARWRKYGKVGIHAPFGIAMAQNAQSGSSRGVKRPKWEPQNGQSGSLLGPLREHTILPARLQRGRAPCSRLVPSHPPRAFPLWLVRAIWIRFRARFPTLLVLRQEGTPPHVAIWSGSKIPGIALSWRYGRLAHFHVASGDKLDYSNICYLSRCARRFASRQSCGGLDRRTTRGEDS